jgi:hypothetical protein
VSEKLRMERSEKAKKMRDLRKFGKKVCLHGNVHSCYDL